MISNLTLIDVQLPGYQDLQQIRINRQGIIEAIAPMKQGIQAGENEQLLDLAGDWISLGGVDLQINGALGLAFPDLAEKHLSFLSKICDYLWCQGVDAFLPTIVTTSVENIQRSLSVIKAFMDTHKAETQAPTARVLGVHLEGPFLNDEKRGAHPAEYLLAPTLENVKWVLGDDASVVKILTLAPELDVTDEVIPYLRSLGIMISLGHSQATAQEAKQAFNLGASMVTHAFNAMPSLHHREPGLLGEAILNKNVYCGLIADGQHVCPTMIELLLRASHSEKGVFLVSDALAPIGL
ncbi:MAG: N-acetylglucosamine-6-phosphate deacetylase, partial [Microcystaceae cyanobacterium]